MLSIRNNKIIFIFMLIFFILTSQAEQKTNGAVNQLSKKHVSDFIQWLNAVGKFEKMSQHDISAHFSNKFQYYTNGKLVATNAFDLHQRYLVAKKYYKSAHIHFPLKNIFVDGNKAAANYRVTFTSQNGVHKDTNNTVIIIFNNFGKVVEFSQSFDIGDPLLF